MFSCFFFFLYRCEGTSWGHCQGGAPPPYPLAHICCCPDWQKKTHLHLSKCQFTVSKLTFLGHIISSEGIEPNPKNVQLILDAPAAETVFEVKSWMGMVGHYSDFFPDLATIAEPLRRLQRNEEPFEWMSDCQCAFDQLKQMIADGLKVYIYNPRSKTFLSTNANSVGLGAILMQMQDGKEVTICCTVHTLMPHERNHSTGECEVLAAVWGCEKFEKFLLGRKFTLCTDHSMLQQLLTNPGRDLGKSSKFMGWAEHLSMSHGEF